eukprot:m.127144 g.127144  ORF g.127144 m.127144 type:complete len:869 (-) comp15648_c0_seq2:313-2919(-)
MRLPAIENPSMRTQGLLQQLQDGAFESILGSEAFKEAFQPVFAQLTAEDEKDFSAERVNSLAKELLEKEIAFSDERAQEMFLFSVAALCAFVQENWTGPSLQRNAMASIRILLEETVKVEKPPAPDADVLMEIKPVSAEEYEAQQLELDLPVGVKQGERSTPIHRRILSCLTADGEEVYAWVRVPILLLVARLVFQDAKTRFPQISDASLYELRALHVHQDMIDATCASIYDRIDAIVPHVEAFAQSLGDRQHQGSVLLELAQIYHTYRRFGKAKATVEKAQDVLQIKVDLSGARGKRTKFQVTSLPQLLLKVSREADREANVEQPLATCPVEHIPQQVALVDDTLLERTQFDDESIAFADQLSPTEQALILTICRNVENANPRDGLTYEEMTPYIDAVIQSPKDWALQSTALLLQSRLEKVKARKLQRSTEQLALVADLFMNSEASNTARLHNIFTVSFPPYWQLQRELAQRYITIGLYRDALVLYERLELWEGVISAHQLLGQDRRAEAIVRARLEVDPKDATLWCALGEITRNAEFFQKAWEVSGERLTKAMRQLGSMLLRQAEHARTSRDVIEKEKYQASIDSFQKCLRLNPLQADVWFSLGCAALRLDQHELVTRAFRRKVEIDDTDFESWNNLAHGYVKTKDMRRAYFAFHEATKHAFDNWKVWENYSAVSADVGAYQETMRSINRLLELKNMYNDWQVLAQLGRGLLASFASASSEQADEMQKQKDQMCQILGNLKNVSVKDYRVWLAAARFYNGIGQHHEAYEARRNAYQLAKAQAGWDKEAELAASVVECLEDMVEGNREGNALKEMQSCKLMVKGVAKTLATAVEKGYGGEAMIDLNTRAGALVEAIDAFIQEHRNAD